MNEINNIVEAPQNFIEEEIEKDLAQGRYPKAVHTRFPPEPNGYLHIGHAKAICLNFAIAAKYGGKTNLRFDDTNPITEDTLFVNSIKDDIKWLGFDWDDREYYASDYFESLYNYAVLLINKGLAYVDESSPDQIAEQKGTPTTPGRRNKFSERTVEENLQLFTEMRAGKYPDGSKVLRAKVDMSSPNMLMRDPIIYRIKHAEHHRTGDAWCVYPMYDFAHGQSDSIEEITHSLCSLEFIHHRPLYNWFIENLEIFPSRQIEFARMNVEYMITSKRKLAKLVEDKKVTGWDDPRMSTISGMRRRGYPAAAIRDFCDKVGIAKRENLIEIALLESCVRDELNKIAQRVMVVFDPIKLTITNYPEDQLEVLPIENNPEDENSGTRDLNFGRHLYIERDDFMVDAPKKFFRLSPGADVRLKAAFIIHCEGYETDDDGNITEVLCTYYPNSKSGHDVSNVKAKGTLHWVNQKEAINTRLHIYDHLFNDPIPDGHEGRDFLEFYNPESLVTILNAKSEPSLMQAKEGESFQFIRKAYFVKDKASTAEHLVFNQTVALKAGWKM